MANKPKMEFPTNVPQTVTIKKMFKVNPAPDDHPDWGASYCYNLIHDGVEKVYFAKDGWHKLAQEYAEGTTVVVCYKEEKNQDTGKPFHKWVMTAALFDKDGRAPQPAPASIKTDEAAHQQFREDRIKNMGEALQDAYEIVYRFNEWLLKSKVDGAMLLTHEDTRAIAVGFKIDYEKKS